MSFWNAHRRAILIIGAVGLAALAAWPLHSWWVTHRTAEFRRACVAASDAKLWKQLDDVAGRWAAWNPKSGDAWLYSAEAAQELGNIRRATDYLAKIPNSDPRCLEALVQRVELLFREVNDPRAAIETCRRILEIDPLVAVARQRLIFFYAMTLEREKMVREIRGAISLRREPPEAYAYLLLADTIHFTNGYAINSRWLENSPDDETFLVARAHHAAMLSGGDHAALSSLPAGKAPDGEELMRGCLERFPWNVEVLAYFLKVAMDVGDVSRVGELLSRIPEEAAEDNRFWRFKGWYHANRDELEPAVEAYREALQQNPYDWESRHELAGVLRQRGETEEAARLAELAVEGKTLSRKFQELPNAADAPGTLLAELMDHAEACGDSLIVRGLRYRLRDSPPVLRLDSPPPARSTESMSPTDS